MDVKPACELRVYAPQTLLRRNSARLRFKPGDHVVNTLIAGGFREGKSTVEELHFMKMIVLEAGIEPTMGFEGYHLIYHSQPATAEYVPGGRPDPWFAKEFVESNFEIL